MKTSREQYLVARIELLTNQLAMTRDKLANALQKNEKIPDAAMEYVAVKPEEEPPHGKPTSSSKKWAPKKSED